MSDDTTLDEFDKDADGDTSDQTPQRQHFPEVGELPSDWHLVTVEDISDDIIGGGTPKKSNEEYWDGGIPWASVKDLNGVRLAETEDYITESGVENSATNLVPADSIIISTRMTVGEPFLNEVDMAINQDMKSVIPDVEQVNSLFAVYSLWDKDPYLKSLGRGTTVDGITTRDLSSTHLGLPSLPEQRKIATVLHTVDQAIQKTEEIIRQVERLKKGVAQDLFRNGLDSEETKETWLGEIPSDWDTVRFEELIESSRNGVYKKEDAYGGETPILKMGDMFGEITFEGSDMERLEMEEDEIEKYRLEEGDLLFARRSLNVEGAGECTLIGDLDETTVFESSLIRVRLESEANPMFFAQYFEGPVGSKSIERIVTTTTASGIAGSDLKNLLVPKPKKEVQKEIADKLSLYDTKIDLLEQEKRRLQRLKKGLMQDLLSGNVRTTNTNIEVPDEIAQHG